VSFIEQLEDKTYSEYKKGWTMVLLPSKCPSICLKMIKLGRLLLKI
jgi:hypothetical protein